MGVVWLAVGARLRRPVAIKRWPWPPWPPIGSPATTTQDSPGGLTGHVSGSPAYMAPEQVQGGKVEPASDLFSLGATLSTAVEGRSPFGKGCPLATLSAIVDEPPAPFRRAGPLGPVIEGLLAKDPGRRLGADQARHALRTIGASGGAGSRPPGGRRGPAGPS